MPASPRTNPAMGETATIEVPQEQLYKLMEDVKLLIIQNAKKDKTIADLARRVEDLEQHSKINDVIITGLRIRPRSNATAVTDHNGTEPHVLEVSSTEQQVAAFLGSKGIPLDLDDIEACHPFPRRRDQDVPAVILRFISREKKSLLLKQGWKLKGTNVYLNDHLTKKNEDIAHKARNLMKQKKIQSTWVNNGKVFIKLDRASKQTKVLLVRSKEELSSFD